MIVTCVRCGAEFDDEFRWTICPHETFAANDGRNNFQHHPGSTLIPRTTTVPGRPPYSSEMLDTEWSAEAVGLYVAKVLGWGQEMLQKISEKEKECTKQR